MYKTFSLELAGRTLSVDIGRVAAQANGAAFMHYGDTTVLSTATASEKPRDGIDFFPLSVEYEEKLYSVGKIPGGFNKREGKASENAILTSRVIDRPMRPLFPKDYRNDVTLNNLVMSVDPECRPELVAMLGSAIATSISDIPFCGPCATTQVGLINGEFIINPNQEQWKSGDMQLTVASTSEKVIMIEAGAKEVPEAKMIEAIYKAHEVNQTIIAWINKIVEEVGKPKHEYESCAIPQELFDAMKAIVTPEEMEVAVFTDEKQKREENLGGIGAVIGHEISHAFDNNGAQCDENGNLANWWTEEDYKKFKELTKGMIDQFDGIEINGGKVSGELVVSENIADNGGMAVTLEIMSTMKDADYEAYFKNWGRIWCMKGRPEYLKLLLSVDVHSPVVLRANMQPRNFEEWYKTFDVKETDKMYIAPEKRICIW